MFSLKEWFRITQKLPFRSKAIIFFLALALAVTTLWWFFAIYQHFTVVGPTKGGQYIEAVTGQPRLINPLLSPGSSASSDRLLTKLLFSGLYTYDSNGELKPDIAESFERSEDGKSYTVKLREDVKWHDGTPLTADDVVFTVNVARDVAYDTVVGALRVAWRDIAVEKVDDYTVGFTLEKPRGDFLHLLTIGVLPQHVWKEIPPVQFQLAEYNAKPIGSGPYAYVSHDTDAEGLVSAYTLRANKSYHRGEPLITRFIMQIYPDRSAAVAAYIDGLVSGVNVDKRELSEELQKGTDSQVVLNRPSYFALFFNRTRSIPLGFAEVRQALQFATDRTAVIDEIFGLNAFPVKSPLFEGMKGFAPDTQQPDFDLAAAQKLLDEKGWVVGDDGIRVLRPDADDAVPLAFTISVNADQDQLKRTAEIVAAQWRQVGADVTLDIRTKDDLDASVVTPREYDALLAFHPMRWDQPNILALWHSREKDHPGLNYGGLQDGPIDAALGDLQVKSDEGERARLYESVQSRIELEDPAVFLFATSFLFSYKSDVKGINLKRVNAPQDRFSNVHEWYIKERRQLKR